MALRAGTANPPCYRRWNMTKFDSECATATAKAVLEMVGHLLRPEEQREFYGMVVDAVRASLLKRDDGSPASVCSFSSLRITEE